METRLVRGRGVPVQIGIRVTLHAGISILAGIQIRGVVVVCILRGLHLVRQCVRHVVGQSLQEPDSELLRVLVICQGVIDILGQSDGLSGRVLGHDRIVAVGKVDIFRKRILHHHIGVRGRGGLALLNLTEDGVQFRRVLGGLVIPGVFISAATIVVVVRCRLWEVAGHRMHELVLVAFGRGRISTGEDADGIHRVTLILQSFRCGDRAVRHQSIEIGHRRRRAVRKEDDDFLRIGPGIFHYLDRALESIVGPGGTSSFKLFDLGFQATHIRSQIAYDLGIVVPVSTTRVHVIPDVF